MKLIIKY